MLCPWGRYNSEVIPQSCSEHGHRRLPIHPSGYLSALIFGLLVLTASLFIVVVTLAVSNPEQSATNGKPHATTPKHRPRVIAARAFKTGERIPTRQIRGTTRTSLRTLSGAADAVERVEVTTQTLAIAIRDNFSTGYTGISEAKLVCGAVSYSYCNRSTPKFYYDILKKSCTASRGTNAALCLKGSNRFPSKISCERSCVLKGRRSPRCEDETTFASCARPDYRRSSLWYFNGRACRLWVFPAGKCPSYTEGAVLFRTSRQCEDKCGNVTRNGAPPGQSRLACKVPDSARCRPDELRYTYFAVKSATHTRCMPISALPRRRCLSGPNRFSTRASCERLCVRNTGHPPVEYDVDKA